MTSANVTHYIVKNKLGEEIARYRQNWLCKNTIREKLKNHKPHKNFTLYCIWPDENEVDNYSTEISLKDYFDGKKVEFLEND